MRQLLRTGSGAILVVLIMFIGSLVLWIGTPLLWLWVGSQIQGATASVGDRAGRDVRSASSSRSRCSRRCLSKL